jgi:uncharacterized protein (TIGR03086 family)
VLATLEVREIYTRSSSRFLDRVHGIGESWDSPTPLPGWNVRDLVNHLVSEQRWAPELFAGATITEIGHRFDGDLLGDDPMTTADRATAAALAAVQADGAVEGIVHLSFGEHPAREYTMQLAADHLIHTWDLARAIGASETLDADAVDAVADWFTGDTEALYRQMGATGPRIPVKPGAPPQQLLLSRFGRAA